MGSTILDSAVRPVVIVFLDPTSDRSSRFFQATILRRPDFLFFQAPMEPFDVAVALRVMIRRAAIERYRAPSTEDTNDRALPVLKALVEADAQEIFHRNRGQYALALMGRKKNPTDVSTSKDDWSEAQDQLTDAIRIRDTSREPNWREYELARAVCRIHLGIEFNQKQDPVSVNRDLDQAKDFVSPEQLKLVDKDDSITTKDGKKVSAITAWNLQAQQ